MQWYKFTKREHTTRKTRKRTPGLPRQIKNIAEDWDSLRLATLENFSGAPPLSLDTLQISAPTHNCLHRLGIETLQQLLGWTLPELARRRGFGEARALELVSRLREVTEGRRTPRIREALQIASASGNTRGGPKGRQSRVLQPQRAYQVRLLYDLLGTYAGVGRVLGLSRERVRQLLAKGERRGWLKARMREARKQRLNPTEFLRTLLEAGDEESLCKRLGWSHADLEKYMSRNGIDIEVLREEYELIKDVPRGRSGYLWK